MTDFEQGPDVYRTWDIGIVRTLGSLTEEKSVSWVEFPAVNLVDITEGLKVCAPVSTQDLVDAGVTKPLPAYYKDQSMYVKAKVNIEAKQISEIQPSEISALDILPNKAYVDVEQAWGNIEE